MAGRYCRKLLKSTEMDPFMKKIEEQGSSVQKEALSAVASGPKQRYESPELVEWGSIVDLTQGPEFSFEDLDVGGSQFV